MARVKRAVHAHKKRRKIFKLAKGYVGGRSKKYTIAKDTVKRALWFAYIGRKLKKRSYRQLWITRINAAARLNGMSYSRFMDGLKKAGVDINRKVLSEMAIQDAAGFTKLAELAKTKIS